MSAPGETPQEDIRNAMAMLELARQLDDAAFVGLEGRPIPDRLPVEIERATLRGVMDRLRSALEKLEGPAVAAPAPEQLELLRPLDWTGVTGADVRGMLERYG